MSDNSSLHEHLRRLEESLLQPEIRQSAQTVGELLAEELVEFGSDGKIYNKRQIIKALQAETTSPKVQWTASDFHIVGLSADVVLVTYRAVLCNSKTADLKRTLPVRPIKSTLRSSLWKLNSGRWQMIFHQGTVVPEP